MMTQGNRSPELPQAWIDRIGEGDDKACAEVINFMAERLAALTRRMFRDYSRLSRWEQSDDICQNAALRLWNALRATRPKSTLEFHRLAALQIRRELIDQVRHYFGPEGMGARHESTGGQGDSSSSWLGCLDVSQNTWDPASLARWAEFHERVALLPEEERTCFDLIWYQGLTQPEAADVLGISERTMKRRWLAARLSLADVHEVASPRD